MGKKTRELEQFLSKQLWCTSIWIWLDYLNEMYFSLPLLVLCQHLRWPRQYPNDPGTCSAHSRHSAMSHSWKAPFAMEFSAIKRPRCSKMIFLVLKKCQVLAKNCQGDGYLTVGSLETNSQVDTRIQEVYWEVFQGDSPIRKRGRPG